MPQIGVLLLRNKVEKMSPTGRVWNTMGYDDISHIGVLRNLEDEVPTQICPELHRELQGVLLS